jgi:hypothetical protein
MSWNFALSVGAGLQVSQTGKSLQSVAGLAIGVPPGRAAKIAGFPKEMSRSGIGAKTRIGQHGRILTDHVT